MLSLPCVLVLVLSCVGLLHQAYWNFKAGVRRDECAVNEEGANASAAIVAASSTDATAQAAAASSPVAVQQRYLRFCILFTCAAYVERMSDRLLGSVPFYRLTKFLALVTLMLPNRALRAFLYRTLHPHLMRADAAFQLHSAHALRRSSYAAHRALLSSSNWLMELTLPYISDRQLQDVSAQAALLGQLTKQEQTRRLHASVQQLPLLKPLHEDDDDSDEPALNAMQSSSASNNSDASIEVLQEDENSSMRSSSTAAAAAHADFVSPNSHSLQLVLESHYAAQENNDPNGSNRLLSPVSLTSTAALLERSTHTPQKIRKLLDAVATQDPDDLQCGDVAAFYAAVEERRAEDRRARIKRQTIV